MRAAGGRYLVCIYFPLRVGRERRTKNVCVAFNAAEELALYREIKEMGSTEIKKRIAIFSYDHLVKVAKKENRGITEVIKMRLGDSLRGGGQIRRMARVSRTDIARWRAALTAETEKPGHHVFKEIEAFLDKLIADEESNARLAA